MRILMPLLLVLPGVFGGLTFAGNANDDNDSELQERAKYETTLTRLKLIGQAALQYHTDNNRFPSAGSPDELKKTLIPDYLPKDTELRDGWDRPFRMQNWDEPKPAPPPANANKTPVPIVMIHQWHFVIASAGSDGIWEKENPRNYHQGWTISREEDVVMLDSEWLRRMKPAAENWRASLDDTRKRLMSLITAIQAYKTDNNSLPEASQLNELVDKLVPDYLPLGFASKCDGWGNPLRFLRWSDPPLADGSPGRVHYRIASAGKDGRFEHDDLRLYGPLETIDPRQDLVIEDDHFVSDCLDPELNNTGRERMTMRKSKTLASEIEQYSTDHNGYPSGDDINILMQKLLPESGSGFEPELMRYDGWRKLIRYHSWQEPTKAGGIQKHYCLASAGPDSKWEFDDIPNYLSVQQPCGSDLSDDIVICDGQFVREPTNCKCFPERCK
jgi:hypothetical protein